MGQILTLHRGRLPAVHTLPTLRWALALAPFLDALGAPPAQSSDYVSAVMKQAPAGWGIFLNNRLGCCTVADSCHQVMLHTANAGSIVIPTDQDCLAAYEAVSGYTPSNPASDRGADENTVCQYMQTTGIAGQKSAGHAYVDPANIEHIKWTVQIFGACRLGIIVDGQMEDQFSSHQPWTTPAAADDPTIGGHDVPVVKYDADYAWVVTWGALQPVAWSLMTQPQFLEEAHCETYPDWVRAGGTAPSGFNLDGLLAKQRLLAYQ